MSKRPSPFDALLRLRSVEERRNRAKLVAARRIHDEARARLEEMKERYREQMMPEDILTPVELRSLQLRGMSTHEILVEAAEEHERTRRHMERIAGDWRRAAEDLDAAERLDQKRKDEMARRARMAAERSLDDLQVILRGNRQDGVA